jgi:FMN phosphatase YigB (HAD superfamily)
MAGSLSRPVAGLLFDMDDVLHDATAWRRWLMQLLARMGLHSTYACLFRVWDRDFLDDVHRGRRPFCEAFEAFLLAVGLSRPQIDEVKAACQARRRELGVLANSESTAEVLGRQLDRYGLEGLFTTVVSSIDLGRTKPDPAAYLTALRNMKLRPEQVAFVGHDTAELDGATAVGMHTVAFNFDRDARADVYLARFEELLDAIGVRTPFAAAG